MKVPANISADRLILEYLSRVADAATRYLPKGGRIAFVGRIRSRIERECGPAGQADVNRVREVLAALGPPEDLVKQERARLDAAWVKRRSGGTEAGEAAAASVTGPRRHRPINSRWKPATGTQPLPMSPGGARRGGQAGAARDAERFSRLRRMRGGKRASGTKDAAPATGGASPQGSTGTFTPDEAEPPVLEGTVIQAPPGPATDMPPGPGRQPPPPGYQQPTGAAQQQPPPSGYQQPAGAGYQPAGAGYQPAGAAQQPTPLVFTPRPPASGAAPPTRRLPRGSPVLRGGAATLGQRVGRLARDAGPLSRRYPLEAAAIILLGVGGLILPFPFWLIGGALAVVSRFWPPRDKWIALTGPLVIALLGTVVTAVIVRGKGNPVEIYTHALGLDVGYLLRAGSVLCAAHLAMQVRHGPRVRLPPWKR
jgi:hypothetical protein